MFPFLARTVLLEIIYWDLCLNRAEGLFVLRFPKAKLEILGWALYGDLKSLGMPFPGMQPSVSPLITKCSLSVRLPECSPNSLVVWPRANCFLSLNLSFTSSGWGDHNDTCFVELPEGLMDLAQNQTYLLVIPNIEERSVGREFSVAESILAEIERSISRGLAEGIQLLRERRLAHLALITCYLIQEES